VTHIEIPAPRKRTGKVYIKHGRRAQMELATVGVAVRVTLDDRGVVEDLGIVLAAVAPTPLRASRAESVLRGERATPNALAAAAQAASEEVRPISDVRGSASYRKEMVRVLTRRARRRCARAGLRGRGLARRRPGRRSCRLRPRRSALLRTP
jgi:aerobic carbon-monoxide dehydrogenase medium subunit